MKERSNYVQNDVLMCAATIRPDYCRYSGNVCCFTCEHNDDCLEISLNKHTIKPCRPLIPIKMKDGQFKTIRLFGEDDRCEFSI